jgi:hypothetical protein
MCGESAIEAVIMRWRPWPSKMALVASPGLLVRLSPVGPSLDPAIHENTVISNLSD